MRFAFGQRRRDMMQHQFSPSRLLGLLLACALCLAFVFRAREVRQQQRQTLGCLTAQQALDRTASLCRVIAPRTAALYLTADPTERRGHEWWYVYAKDTAGRELGNF